MNQFPVIIGSNINELIYLTSQELLSKGSLIESRAGGSIELIDVSLILKNPRNRHLYLFGRKNNIFTTIAETFLVLSCSNKIFPFLNFYLHRAKDFSDNYSEDKKEVSTWRGAYGPRLFIHNQLANLISTFQTEGLNTRKAVLALWQPEFDTFQRIKELTNMEKTKDIPCNLMLNFWIRNNKLNLKVFARSIDLIWGLSGINIFEFTMIQELLLDMLKKVLPDGNMLELGYYHHSITSLHVYNFTKTQADNIIMSKNQDLETYSTKDTIFSLDYNTIIGRFQSFFVELINFYEKLIKLSNKINFNNSLSDLNTIFKKFNVEINNNQLYDYACALFVYTYTRVYKIKELAFNDANLSVDFKKYLNFHTDRISKSNKDE